MTVKLAAKMKLMLQNFVQTFRAALTSNLLFEYFPTIWTINYIVYDSGCSLFVVIRNISGILYTVIVTVTL